MPVLGLYVTQPNLTALICAPMFKFFSLPPDVANDHFFQSGMGHRGNPQSSHLDITSPITNTVLKNVKLLKTKVVFGNWI